MSVQPLDAPSVAGLVARVPGFALRTARRLTATLAYTAALSLVTVVTSQLDDGSREWLVRTASTNLHNLGRGHLSTLITSAFITTEPSATWWLALVGLMALIELRWGSWRAVGVFAAGHIGATVLVAVGLAIGVQQGWASQDVAHAVDVGISYGVLALVGAITAELPAPGRPVWALTWVLASVTAALTGRDFTSVGHVCALGIGLAIAAAQVHRRAITGTPA